jgi:hypothetical protein
MLICDECGCYREENEGITMSKTYEIEPASDVSERLEDRMESAIEARQFNFLEIRGFQSKPLLALIAGSAIGYALAIEDFKKTNTEAHGLAVASTVQPLVGLEMDR